MASIFRMRYLLSSHCLLYLSCILYVDFSRFPESQNVGLGLDAVFHCQHRGALSIGWLVNGVPENRLNDSGMFIKSGNYRDEDNSLVYTLTILARPEYNETVVECVATFLDSLPQKSPLVTLTIEGLILYMYMYYCITICIVAIMNLVAFPLKKKVDHTV